MNALKNAFLLLVLSAGAAAAEPAALSEATGDELTKAKGLADARNWDGAIAALEGRLAKVDPDSFDAAVLQQVNAQIRLQKNDIAGALPPLARALETADKRGYFDENARIQIVYLLAQLYFQEATAGRDPSAASAAYESADALMVRWNRATPRPSYEPVFFHASLLYNYAVAGRQNPDLDLIRRAAEQIDRALLLVNRPGENLYQLKLACLQQLGRFAESAEVLEILVAIKPGDAGYWSQLVSAYVGAAGGTKDPKLAYSFNVRSILAIERAQKNGFMNTSKDRFSLIGIHFNIQQFDRAIEMLGTGLRGGAIDNDRKNWELLAYSYQQIGRESEAIKALEEASVHFPQAAQLDYQIAQLQNAVEQPEKAVAYLEKCIAKGGGDAPHAAYLFLAYLSLELKSFDRARQAAESAMKYPEGQKEGQRMKKAVEDILAARAAARS